MTGGFCPTRNAAPRRRSKRAGKALNSPRMALLRVGRPAHGPRDAADAPTPQHDRRPCEPAPTEEPPSTQATRPPQQQARRYQLFWVLPPDSPGTGAVPGGRPWRTAGGDSVPQPEGADLLGTEPEVPEPTSSELLPSVPARERLQGAGSVCLLEPMSVPPSAACHCCVRVELGSDAPRQSVAGWGPRLCGLAARGCRPSGTTDGPEMGSGGSCLFFPFFRKTIPVKRIDYLPEPHRPEESEIAGKESRNRDKNRE